MALEPITKGVVSGYFSFPLNRSRAYETTWVARTRTIALPGPGCGVGRWRISGPVANEERCRALWVGGRVVVIDMVI